MATSAVAGGDHDRAVARGDHDRSVAQLRMLHSLASRLNQLNDVAQIGEAITAELRTVVDYHNCRVHLISQDGTTLVPIAFRGELSEYQGETFDALLLQVGAGITGLVAVTGESYYTPNTNDDPHAVLIPGTPEVDESLVVVPLKHGLRVIGTIGLAKLGIDQFDHQEIQLLEVLASHAAVAIENARLLRREREAARISGEMLKFSQSLTRLTDAPSVLDRTAATIPAMIECSGAQVYLRRPDSGDFERVAGSEDSRQVPPHIVPAEVADRFLISVEEPFVLSQDVLATAPRRFGRRRSTARSWWLRCAGNRTAWARS